MYFEKGLLAFLVITAILFLTLLSGIMIFKIKRFGKVPYIMLMLICTLIASVGYTMCFNNVRQKLNIDITPIQSMNFASKIEDLNNLSKIMGKDSAEYNVTLGGGNAYGAFQSASFAIEDFSVEIYLSDKEIEAQNFYEEYTKACAMHYGIQEKKEINGNRYFISYRNRNREYPGYELNKKWDSYIIFQRKNIYVKISENTGLGTSQTLNKIIKVLTEKILILSNASGKSKGNNF